MGNRFSRRSLLAMVGTGTLLGGTSVAAQAKRNTVEDLQAALEEIPVADVHGHAFSALAPVTEKMFLAELSLAAWMLRAYFPTIEGQTAWDRWKVASESEKARLDRQYGIEKRLDEICYQMSTTIFVDYLVKEMAKFFKCKPTLKDVIAARNEYSRTNYWQFVNDLFSSVKIQDLFIQGGGGAGHDRAGGSGIGAWTVPPLSFNDFKKALRCRVFHVPSSSAGSLLEENISLDDLVSRYTDYLRNEVKQYNAVGYKSGIAKNVGADVQPMTRAEAEQAWNEFKSLSPEQKQKARERSGLRLECYKKVEHYLLWQSLEVAYQLDVPLHIHIGNGEYQDMLSTHYPYKLENVIRYPVEFPQKPVKIVLLHAGYPHVGEAAYLTHIFPNAWFSMCLMNPIANRGLHERMLSVFETAPVSKIMFGSDSYGVPEFNYLAAKWGRRYIGSALAVLVDEGILTKDEAVKRGRMMLLENVHRLHKTNSNRS